MILHDYIAEQMYKDQQAQLMRVTIDGWKYVPLEASSPLLLSLKQLFTHAKPSPIASTVQEACCTCS